MNTEYQKKDNRSEEKNSSVRGTTSKRKRGGCGFIASRKSTILHEVCRQLACAAEQRFASLYSNGDVCCDGKIEAAVQARQQLLNLDGKCEYCEHRTAMTTDHFYPLVKNRKPSGYCNDVWNSVPCCRECNSSKGGKTYAQWLDARDMKRRAQMKRKACPSNNKEREDKEEEETAATFPGGEVQERRIREKFSTYDRFFCDNCLRIPTLDDAWWDATCRSVDEFLEALQRRVDAYFCENSS